MLHVILAVRDRQLQSFMRPFTAQTIGQAIRSFADETNNPQSELNKHPEDYELFQLGTFDEQTGAITPTEHKIVAIASNLITRSKT